MNITLFLPQEDPSFIPLKDPRAEHLIHILKLKPGESFDLGIVKGKAGKGMVKRITNQGIEIIPSLYVDPLPLYPIILLLGMTRPIMAKRILKEATTLGVREVIFCNTEKGERSYGLSSFYKNKDFLSTLVEGASQAFTTLIPEVRVEEGFERVITEKRLTAGNLLALDNYEGEMLLGQINLKQGDTILALGSERGWSSRERVLLRDTGFLLVSLGARVLKTETACITSVSLALHLLGYL